MSPSVALVYRGPGASSRSVNSAVRSLQRVLPPEDFVVQTATPGQVVASKRVITPCSRSLALRGRSIDTNPSSSRDLLSSDEEWEASTSILCFPGGADVPYLNSLGAGGMERVRHYVEEGGVYIGLCAGAYFASGAVAFEAGTDLEVIGERYLKFYRGLAAGAAYPGFDYSSERGAVSAKIRYINPSNGEWRSTMDYVNGGPFWMIDDTDAAVFRINSVNHRRLDGVDILATYEDLNHAVAAMRCRVGEGVAILCGSHPELSHDDIADVAEVDELYDLVYAEHVARLKENLRQHEAARTEFFAALVAAGLEAKVRNK